MTQPEQSFRHTETHFYKLALDSVIRERYPNCSVLVIYAHDLVNGPSDEWSTALLREAEGLQRERLSLGTLTEQPVIAAWREVYRSFGAKPKKYPSSVEALLTRVLRGQDLPPINKLVDVYNAISVKHTLPVGGENWEKLSSDLVLKVATGSEPFATIQEGEQGVSYPEPGEVVWADSAGVSCRRWNWRQGYRTRLTEETRHAYFVLERMAPYSIESLKAAGNELMELLKQASPQCTLSTVLLGEGGE